MGLFKKNPAVEDVKATLKELQANLENNYKDLAIGARKTAEKKLNDYKDEGKISGKDYLKLKAIVDDYTKRMEGYHH